MKNPFSNRIQSDSGTALYRGKLRHRRFLPTHHQFDYNITMVMLDLDRLEQELSLPGILGVSRRAIGRFRRSDYIGDHDISLRETLLSQVESEIGYRPQGRITLLTHLRYWGFMMNPLAIFYCHGRDGTLEAVGLQVTNTPWREKILYVLKPDRTRSKQCFRFPKKMHVSPFNPMEMDYLCRFQPPAGKLFFHLENHAQGECHTDATMVLNREQATTTTLAWLSLRQPAMTMVVGFGIYWQALRLWLKKSPIYQHPEHDTDSGVALDLNKAIK